MSGPDDTLKLVEYESECPIAPNGKHKWRLGEVGTGKTIYQECAHCSALTKQRKLCG